MEHMDGTNICEKCNCDRRRILTNPWAFYRPANGSPSATNVVLVLVVVIVLRLFHFTTDRRQTSHTDWLQHYP